MRASADFTVAAQDYGTKGLQMLEILRGIATILSTPHATDYHKHMSVQGFPHKWLKSREVLQHIYLPT